MVRVSHERAADGDAASMLREDEGPRGGRGEETGTASAGVARDQLVAKRLRPRASPRCAGVAHCETEEPS